jgi:hypothetical protein
LIKHAREMDHEQVVIINLSGRGDKDVQQVAQFLAVRREEESSTTNVLEGGSSSFPNAASNGSP